KWFKLSLPIFARFVSRGDFNHVVPDLGKLHQHLSSKSHVPFHQRHFVNAFMRYCPKPRLRIAEQLAIKEVVNQGNDFVPNEIRESHSFFRVKHTCGQNQVRIFLKHSFNKTVDVFYLVGSVTVNHNDDVSSRVFHASPQSYSIAASWLDDQPA